MQDDPTPALSQALGLDDAMPVDEKALHVRYVRALALLCECAAYVDEPHYIAQIEEMLRDAAGRYPLDCERRTVATSSRRGRRAAADSSATHLHCGS